ncbi:MAG: alanine racemase [Bacillota bacterium]|jgi:alanine racemase
MKAHEIKAPARVEVDLAAVAHNIKQIRRRVGPDIIVMGITKANAYGHGAEEIAHTILRHGAQRLGVANLYEGVGLRLAGIGAPVMTMGYILPQEITTAIKYNIIQMVYSYEMAENISRQAVKKKQTATIHIKVDTGMGRIGFLPNQHSVGEIKRIFSLPNLFVEGLCSHFSTADEKDKTYSRQQLDCFNKFTKALAAEGLEFPIKHMANSAAILDLPESYYDMVRPGISLYGYYPSTEVKQDQVRLLPALSMKCNIAMVKELPAGSAISYCRNYHCQGSRVIATIPVGYGDGLGRIMSPGGEVLINGQRAPMVGNICMDYTMVDVTDIKHPYVGDEVVLIGRQGLEQITLEEVAAKHNTINYEFICHLSERLPRIYLNK